MVMFEQRVLAKIIYCINDFDTNITMKKQTVIQIKETLSLLPANIKLHFIS